MCVSATLLCVPSQEFETKCILVSTGVGVCGMRIMMVVMILMI